MTTHILAPCPPNKHCRICEARLSEVFGSADHTNKYRHQASEAGLACIRVLSDVDVAVALAIRAASYANMVLEGTAEERTQRLAESQS